jgi:hypothetical protein
MNDRPCHRWSGMCICIHGRLTGWFSGQANTPPPSGGFFHSFSHQWSRHQLRKNAFSQRPLVKSLNTRFRQQERPPWPITPPKSQIAHPSGYQATATFSLHGKLLPPFSAKLRSSFETFNRSPKGRRQNVGVDKLRPGGFPKR